MRAGTQTLSLLARPFNAIVLQALAEEPGSLVDLRRSVGSPPQTTVRAHLRSLSELGLVSKHRQNDFPGSLNYELAPRGRELLKVADTVEAWLAVAPDGPLSFGSTAAQSAIKALVEGWRTNMLRALAARPLSLTELGSLLTSISYPSIERRLGAMRLAGQVEAVPGDGKGTPYAVTSWMRKAVGPLFAAARWESLHLDGESKPIGRRDVETAFLLAVPLVRLSPDCSGRCRLALDVSGGESAGSAGVTVEVEEGRIGSCVSRLDSRADAWSVGPADSWFAAMIDGDAGQLALGGDPHLAGELVARLHEKLFKIEAESRR